MGRLTRVPGFIKTLGQPRLAGPRDEAPPSRAGWLSGWLPEGGQPKSTAPRVTGSWRPPSREVGNGQADTSQPRCGRAPIESTSQSMATVKHVASHTRYGHGYRAPYRRRSPHDGALCRIYPTLLRAGGALFPMTVCRYGLPEVGPIRQ